MPDIGKTENYKFIKKAEYTNSETFNSDNDIVNKKYVDDTVIGGLDQQHLYFVGKAGNDGNDGKKQKKGVFYNAKGPKNLIIRSSY